EKAQILVVDDEPASRYGIKKALSQFRSNFVEASTGKEALEKIVQFAPHVVILDINLPEMDGLSVLAEVKKQNSRSLIIIITAYGSEKLAVEAMKKGAYDYISKPYDIEELRMVIGRALESLELKEENLQLRKELEKSSGYGKMLGRSMPMRKVFDLI